MNDLAVIRPTATPAITIEYFQFEEDFVEDNIRCIPMVVRCKMDIVGIKLSLAAWVRFTPQEKDALAQMHVATPNEIIAYDQYLCGLILNHTGETAARIQSKDFKWNQQHEVPAELKNKASEFGWSISLAQWKTLSNLQRFALLKLCRPGHENRNFPIAVKEFRLYE